MQISEQLRVLVYKIWLHVAEPSDLYLFSDLIKPNFMFARLQQSTLAIFAALTLILCLANAPLMQAGPVDWQELSAHPGTSLLDKMIPLEVVDITITADFGQLLDNRKNEDYVPATFSYKDEKGTAHSFDAKMKQRGKFRRMTCDFPPMKLKFSKKELQAAGLSDMNELKLVTHCLDDRRLGNDLVLKEYLIYKLYNELTPVSFRVKLVKVTYKDSAGKFKKMTRWGFLIEDEEELNARQGTEACHCLGEPKESFMANHERIASLFQFMIGNVDWSLETVRNVKLLKNGEGKLMPVPYDFDFSGLVGAPYARLNTKLEQKDIRERFFMGLAGSSEEIYSTISYFKTKKQALYRIVSNFKYLDEDTKLAMREYLESFYAVVEDMQRVQTDLFDKRKASGLEVNR